LFLVLVLLLVSKFRGRGGARERGRRGGRV